MDLSEDPKLAAVRTEMPVLANWNYLNTGTAGPMPRPVATAVADAAAAHLGEPRTGRAYFDRVEEVKAACRRGIASMIHCEPEEVSLTHNTTEGMNLVTLGVNWVPGDEAVTTNVEHPGGLLPLWVASERFGVTVKTADLRSGADPLDAVLGQLSARTKLISLSHVSYATGDVLPVAEIAAEARARSVLVLVDGAQAFGAIPLDMSAMGVDFYALSGQKWLCGPEGTGALYSRRGSLSQIRVTFAGYGSMVACNDYGGWLVRPDSRRFEQGTMHLPDISGQLAALEWFTGLVGEDWAYARIQNLADRAMGVLGDVPGVEVITSERHAGLVSLRLASVDPEAVVERLWRRGVIVRSIESPMALRFSLGFFNTPEEIDSAALALGEELGALG